MIPSTKVEARIMLVGSVGVRLYACSTKSENFEMYSCMAKSVCLYGLIYVWPLWSFHTLKIFPVREVSLQTNVYLMNAALAYIYGVIPLKLLNQHSQDPCRK